MPAPPAASLTSFLKLLGLLWLAGMTMRITILAAPPVLPLIHADLHMTETQVGLLIGLPLVVFALCAVPGSLFVARFGAPLTMLVGMLITALAGAGRGGANSVWLLYAATLAMGFGVAIMQPALPTLVRAWAPQRIGLATAVSTNGMLVGVTLGPALTIPVLLPLIDQSWRLEFVLWAAPVLVTALLFILLSPPTHRDTKTSGGSAQQWWPDWRSPLIWLLGLTFGSNNALYYGANAFLPDYLTSMGRADLIGSALGWLNGAQLVASFVLLAIAGQLQRRAWPYLVFGPLALAGLLGVVLADGHWIVLAAGVVGFSTAVTFVMTLALPPILSPPDDVHRMAGGMFTISYSCAVIVPIFCGALWDLTGMPWTAFVPLGLCALTLTALGFALSRHRPR